MTVLLENTFVVVYDTNNADCLRDSCIATTCSPTRNTPVARLLANIAALVLQRGTQVLRQSWRRATMCQLCMEGPSRLTEHRNHTETMSDNKMMPVREALSTARDQPTQRHCSHTDPATVGWQHAQLPCQRTSAP